MTRRSSVLLIIFLLFNFILIEDVLASSFDLKIPFPKGEKWKVTQGYEGDGWIGSNPTHATTNKDRYAIDFSLPGEEDYGKTVLAVSDGVAYIKEQFIIDKITGQKNLTGYGQYIDIDHGSGVISRYAHLLSYSIENGQQVKQGQEIGKVDNTGYKGGSHLHFAMYQKDANGNLTPYKPEPMSGYTNFTAGQWYTSDNELYDPTLPPPEPIPQPTSQPQTQPKVSLWSKILNFFSSLFASESEEAKSEEVQGIGTASDTKIPPSPPLTGGEITNTPLNPPQGGNTEGNYNLQFLNSGQSLVAEPGEVLNLKVEIKNTGTAVWKKQNISANVVGGSVVNLQYYHSSWLTYLRPVLLDQAELHPGETGSFSFVINTSERAGNYIFKIQAVRTDAGFVQIPSGFWTVNLNLTEDEPPPVEVKQDRIEEKTKTIIEKIFDITEEKKEEAVKIIKTIFNWVGGGGSSNTNNSTSTEVPTDEPEGNATTTPPIETPTSTPSSTLEIILPEIQITSPTISPWITQTSSTIIVGAYNTSTEYIFVCQDASACDPTTTTPNLIMTSSTWQYAVSLPVGTSTFSFIGWDEELTTSSQELVLEIVREEEISPDITPPMIESFNIETTTSTATASYIAVDESDGEIEYNVQFLLPLVSDLNPQSDCLPEENVIHGADDPLLTNLNNLLPSLMQNSCQWFNTTTTATTTIFNFIPDLVGAPLYFRLQAVDVTGNISDWQYSDLIWLDEDEIVEGKIIISEIAWMGTLASPHDEWLELYNDDSISIFLGGWQLQWGDNIIILEDVLLDPGDTWLLERTDQNTVSDYDWSQVYAGALNNDGEHLILYSSLGNIMDEVDASGGWFAGDNETKESMFRVYPFIDGNLPEAWVDFFSSETALNGWYVCKYDADGNPIAGSPGNEATGMW